MRLGARLAHEAVSKSGSGILPLASSQAAGSRFHSLDTETLDLRALGRAQVHEVLVEDAG